MLVWSTTNIICYYALTIFLTIFIGDAVFQPDDAILILQEIIEVKEKYFVFGLLLKVESNVMYSIHYQHSDPEDCLLQVIEEFMKQAEPEPTWRVIINILSHPLLNYTELAQKIEREFMGTIYT